MKDKPTPKQKTQRDLAWKLKVVMGSRGNLYPREKTLPHAVAVKLTEIYNQLWEAETLLRKALKEIK